MSLHPTAFSVFSTFRALVFAVLAVLGMALAAPVLAQDNPSGLPLPRFASTRSDPINVRVGPGTRYDIAWTYLAPGVPVEIIQEFDTWRKIRDVDGDEGWVHQNLLSGERIGYVAPWNAEALVNLVPNRSDGVAPRAILGSKFRIAISECDGSWCAVSATHRGENDRLATYAGFVEQQEIWGVYGSEVFD